MGHNMLLKSSNSLQRNGISNTLHQVQDILGAIRSNGLTKRTVQTAKKLLSKAFSSGQDPYLAILEYQNTPVDEFATAGQLLSRNLRSTIPALRTHFKPKEVDARDFPLNREMVKQQQTMFHDKHGSSLPLLKEQEHVRIRDGKCWKPATVIKKVSGPRSYIWLNSEGRKYRRNRAYVLQ